MEPTGDAGSGFGALGGQIVWRGRRLSIERRRFRAPDGEEFERDVVRHPGAVAIVPVHDDGTVTLVRQLRAAVGETVLEVPAGTWYWS